MVLMIKEMSGSLYLFNGVGTQRMSASTSPVRLKSIVASNRDFRAEAISSGEMCSI